MITIYDARGYLVKWSGMNYSGGEVKFQLEQKIYKHNIPVKIVAHLYSSNDVMQLLMATDSLRRAGATEIDLVMPYVPYARQDRVCNEGEALSIKVFCTLINAQGYRSVEIWDPHSDVTPALLDRCSLLKQSIWASQIPRVQSMVLVSPDGGALKKVYDLQGITKQPVVVGQKHRDPQTGEITGVSVSHAGVAGYKVRYRDLLIVDDICDGGRTFIELAKTLREAYFKRGLETSTSYANINLYVTHGIFSKGLDVLKPHIDHVYTANIWPDLYKGNEDYVTIVNRT